MGNTSMLHLFRRLEPVCMASQNLHDATGCRDIKVEIRSEVYAIRAELPGAGNGHGRSHAELPGFIRGTTNNAAAYAALGIGSDYYRLALQLRMLSDLDRWEEGIQIDMQDNSHFTVLVDHS